MTTAREDHKYYQKIFDQKETPRTGISKVYKNQDAGKQLPNDSETSPTGSHWC